MSSKRWRENGIANTNSTVQLYNCTTVQLDDWSTGRLALINLVNQAGEKALA